ncbi:hypothetical protein [Fibrella arboris]
MSAQDRLTARRVLELIEKPALLAGPLWAEPLRNWWKKIKP